MPVPTPKEPSLVTSIDLFVQQEIERLREEIRHHDYLYHVKGEPDVSDDTYDALFRRLQALEADHPELVTGDSPTQRVGGEPREDLPTIPHAAPMLSLDSSKDPEDLRRFDERIRNTLSDNVIRYILEPKLDGVSLEIVYEDGVLTRAVTRGNGREGEGVTENVRTIANIPLRLRSVTRPSPSFLAVRGEVILRLSAFEALNQRLLEGGSQPFANPRNAASGSLRQLDSSVTASRPLECLVYDILKVEGTDFARDQDALQALQDWGLPVPDRIEAGTSVDDILAYHAAFDADRNHLDYEIDGIVIKLDALADRVAMGMTSHHPRWAMAFKFEPRKEITRIERIAIQVGRTGALTPVALLLPVEVGGVTVSRATLHNREELIRKDVREGDWVRIQRAGDVIPQVVEVLNPTDWTPLIDSGAELEDRNPPFIMPEFCPACQTPVEERGPVTFCPNTLGCEAQLKGRIVHFASRHALDIEGLGDETVTLLVDEGLVKEPADLFALRVEDLTPLPLFGERRAENLVTMIQARREVELARFIAALGVPQVGASVARDLAAHFRHFEALRTADQETLEALHGIGPKMAEAIVGFFTAAANQEPLDRLAAWMVFPDPTEHGDRTVAGPLEGMTIVFTGALESMTREAARALVEQAGGSSPGSVSRSTQILVAGPGAGSKRAKAESLGVQVMDEMAFLRWLQERGISAPTS